VNSGVDMKNHGYNKYGSQKTFFNGIWFDSAREADRYAELLLLQRAGRISDLRLQVKYVLIPAQYEYYERYGKNGKRLKDGKKCIEKECSYVADFVYEEDGKTVVEDVKGMRTKEYLIKRKLCLYIHGVRIREV
jgi:hypothetical protein